MSVKIFHSLKQRKLTFLGILAAIILVSVFFNSSSEEADQKFSKFREKQLHLVDKVIKKDASVKKAIRKPAIPEVEQPLLKDARKDTWTADNLLLINLTRQLQELNKGCEGVAEQIFQDNNYIDPQFEMYGDAERVKGKIDRVFKEMLLQVKAKKAFDILKTSIDNSQEGSVAPKAWDKALKNLDVCRENEIFYFFETMFESFRYDQLSEKEKTDVISYFLKNINGLLGQQQTMSNLLFITNLVIKSTRAISAEEYLINDAKRIFDDLVDFWRINVSFYQEQEGEGKDKKLGVDFYRDYIRQSEYYHQELNKIIEELLF